MVVLASVKHIYVLYMFFHLLSWLGVQTITSNEQKKLLIRRSRFKCGNYAQGDAKGNSRFAMSKSASAGTPSHSHLDNDFRFKRLDEAT